METGKKKGLFGKLVSKYGVESFEYSMLKAEYNENRLGLLEAELIEKHRPTLNTSWGFGNLRYPVSLYKDILIFKSNNLNSKLKDVCCKFPDINPRVVSDIINLRKYSWLKDALPTEYGVVLDHLLY